MLKIASLDKLIHQLSQLPGIGPKTAGRLAYFILRAPQNYSTQLADTLKEVKEQVHLCPECFSYTDRELCPLCENPSRLNGQLCIVEEPIDILRVESAGAFQGKYHVLHGAIAPLDGIEPRDLKIQELLDRIDRGVSGHTTPIQEVILALDTDLEGDTTTLYLSKLLKNRNIRVSRIAHGIPIGSDIDYIDERTMSRALENRVEL